MTENRGNIILVYRFDSCLELTEFTATINSINKFEINTIKIGCSSGNFLKQGN